MKQFNEKLAVKIFDHFFKKSNVNKIRLLDIFQSTDSRLYLSRISKDTFILDVYFNDNNVPYILFDEYSRSHFRLIRCNRESIEFIKQNHRKIFDIDRFPDFLKASVIKSCIDGKALPRFVANSCKEPLIIPNARSLEELLVLIDLEA